MNNPKPSSALVYSDLGGLIVEWDSVTRALADIPVRRRQEKLSI